MKQFPSIPRGDDAPEEMFQEGHLWLLEKVDGANMRFQLQQSGLLRFGDRSNVYDDPDAMPDPYRHAVRHVRDNLDRDALRRAVEDVEAYVFFGEAMHHHTIDYDWDRTPSFLGFDIWSTADDRFLSPDVVQGIYERLGLQPVNAVERERRAREFDPTSYDIPQSAWYDGPAEGVVVRNKRGGRAKLLHPDVREVDEAIPVDADGSTLAHRYATQQRFRKLAAKLEDREQPVTVETLYERALEDIVREEHKRLYHGADPVDMQSFRSEVAALTRAFLDAR
ncbi:RNA ligase family protein [Haloarcula sp. 1CSR25-25]|uniref:RNA ligase family protein n=1 Tax=Haloarcula sp. 1CSR25-25 TaxID=2862545 RepID=UPI0028939402|nr:RNA ligase family protein [Haloarcula sp. 1CSR25-25]MDT3436703.1 RNA ligase family protein [Haloarcula sp. 1CSR25-25]